MKSCLICPDPEEVDVVDEEVEESSSRRILSDTEKAECEKLTMPITVLRALEIKPAIIEFQTT